MPAPIAEWKNRTGRPIICGILRSPVGGRNVMERDTYFAVRVEKIHWYVMFSWSSGYPCCADPQSTALEKLSFDVFLGFFALFLLWLFLFFRYPSTLSTWEDSAKPWEYFANLLDSLFIQRMLGHAAGHVNRCMGRMEHATNEGEIRICTMNWGCTTSLPRISYYCWSLSYTWPCFHLWFRCDKSAVLCCSAEMEGVLHFWFDVRHAARN